MGYSECDRFLVSLYYVYSCALLKKGSSEVRTFPNSNGRHSYTTSCYCFLPYLFRPLLSSPCLLFFLPSWSLFHHPSSLLTPLLSCSSPSFCPPLLFTFPLLPICSPPLIPLPSLLPSFPSLFLSQSSVSALDQFEMLILKYQSSMTFPPAHYGMHNTPLV